ncbi:unnamed protein product [Rhizophagus irregularis]|nr:unnamed protein product [Rhizophagus irregularis]
MLLTSDNFSAIKFFKIAYFMAFQRKRVEETLFETLKIIEMEDYEYFATAKRLEQNACQVRIDALDTNIQKLTRKRPNENDYDEYSKTNTEQNENMNEKNRKDRHQPQDEKGTISSDSKNDFQKVKLMIGEDTNVNLVLEKSQAIKHQIHLSEYSENPSEKTIHDGYFTTPKQYEINIEDDDNVRNILKRKTNEDNNDEELFENAIFLFNRSNEEALIKKVDENSLLDETQLPLGKKMAQIA